MRMEQSEISLCFTYIVLILSDYLLSGSGCDEHSLCSWIVFIDKCAGLFILRFPLVSAVKLQ